MAATAPSFLLTAPDAPRAQPARAQQPALDEGFASLLDAAAGGAGERPVSGSGLLLQDEQPNLPSLWLGKSIPPAAPARGKAVRAEAGTGAAQQAAALPHAPALGVEVPLALPQAGAAPGAVAAFGSVGEAASWTAGVAPGQEAESRRPDSEFALTERSTAWEPHAADASGWALLQQHGKADPQAKVPATTRQAEPPAATPAPAGTIQPQPDAPAATGDALTPSRQVTAPAAPGGAAPAQARAALPDQAAVPPPVFANAGLPPVPSPPSSSTHRSGPASGSLKGASEAAEPQADPRPILERPPPDGADGRVKAAASGPVSVLHGAARLAGGSGLPPGPASIRGGEAVAIAPSAPLQTGSAGLEAGLQASPAATASPAGGAASAATQAAASGTAQAGGTPQPPPGPAGPPAAQLGQAVAGLHIGGGASGHVSIRLNPQELGGVDIQLRRSQDGGATTLSLAVERPETLRALQADLTHLHQALDRAGVPVEQRSVTLHLAAPDGGAAQGDGRGSGNAGQGGGSSPSFQRPSQQGARQATDDAAPPAASGQGWRPRGFDITA